MARIFFALLFLLAAPGASLNAAETPCDVLSATAFPAPDQPPLVNVWSASSALERVALEPPCAGLPLDAAKLIITIRGSFRFDGSLDDLLQRIGAIASLPHLKYWSVTEKRWLPLIKEAQALSRPVPEARRDDFSPAELRQGDARYYLQHDNRSSRAAIYQMRVTAGGHDRVAIDSENVTPLKYLLVTLFHAGTLHTHVRLQRIAPGLWSLVQLDWVGPGASVLAFMGRDASYVNRTAALFRHVAGLPTDQEPPVAP
ncbi:MAG TPA: DUF6675 family protein [Alphaproteobacteria bacterium]